MYLQLKKKSYISVDVIQLNLENVESSTNIERFELIRFFYTEAFLESYMSEVSVLF